MLLVGVPGPLSQSYLQKENYLSAATLIARGVTSNSFDGTIKYDVNGNMIAGFDVQVYAAGLRNPFDVRNKSREFLLRSKVCILSLSHFSTLCSLFFIPMEGYMELTMDQI